MFSELEEVPYQNPASTGRLVAPLKEPDRETSVELAIIGLPLLTEALGSLLSVGSSPPASPPDGSQLYVTTILVNLNDPVIVNITLFTFDDEVHFLSSSETVPLSADIAFETHVVVP